MNEQPTTNRQLMNKQRPTTNNDHSNAHKRYLRAFSLRPDTRHPTENKDAHKSRQTPPPPLNSFRHPVPRHLVPHNLVKNFESGRA